MNTEYNSRQRKIYKDYIAYSTDVLLEMRKQDEKYIPEVLEIICDILVERRARMNQRIIIQRQFQQMLKLIVLLTIIMRNT